MSVPVQVPPTAEAGTATTMVGLHVAVLFPEPAPVTTGAAGVVTVDSVMVVGVMTTVPVGKEA